MHYTCQIEIDAPRDRVMELMTDGDRASEWMPGLASYRATVGERGHAGSTSELVFRGMPRSDATSTMVEKVQRRDDEHYDVVYLVGPVRNENRNTFVALEDGRTRWIADHVFLMPPGMEQGLGDKGLEAFRTNTQRSMETFKTWCEANA